MITIPVWPLPYWATACLLCLAYLPMGWAVKKSYNQTDRCDATLWDALVVVCLIGMLAYTFIPGFYFSLSLMDVQWAYLEGK